MRSCVLPSLLVLGATSAEWQPIQQVKLENPSSVSVSPSGAYAAYSVSTVDGAVGNLTAAGNLFIAPLASGAGGPEPVPLCADGGCSAPAFASDDTLAFLRGGDLYQLSSSGSSSSSSAAAPVLVPTAAPARGGILSFAVSPDGKRVAYTYAEMGTYDKDAARVVGDDDVIVNVITGTPQPTRNVLCVGAFGGAAAAAGNATAAAGAGIGTDTDAQCYDGAQYASVGMEGWRISCWPFESQFSWRADSAHLALTLTQSRAANGWESVRLATLDTTAAAGPAAPFVPVGGPISFQPAYSPDGKWLAYTQADSAADAAAGKPDAYTWAQTWKVCVVAAAAATGATGAAAAPLCDEVGTADAMPVLVGWAGGGGTLLYMEQAGTTVGLFSMAVNALTGQPGGTKAAVTGTPCPADGDCGVLGGGFRATSRVSLSADGSHVAFSWENLHTAPQAFVGALSAAAPVAVSAARQVSALNAESAKQAWPAVSTRTWASDDGTPVSGLLIHAATPPRADGRPAPLLVFTHCGPAMASLSTFLGAGSVCARFPLATWAQRGYNVLLPNYRGSTGYGRAFRRADLDGWGAGDYEDVMSGYVAMATDGLAALDNVAHVGWSYGGYTGALALTKAAATHAVGLKAVVAGGLLSDLISQTGTTDISLIYRSSNGGRYFWDDAAVEANFRARSAMYHVANASAPTLMFHGQQDPRMPISQAFQLHYALQARNVTNRFLVFPGSGHIPGNQNQIVRVWQESLDWIAAHVPL